MAKPILISGIKPSGNLHVGNFLGALQNFVNLQNSGKYECYFFIADYHAMTEPFDVEERRKEIMDLAVTYLAAGLDPKKSTLFFQSHVPYSTELAWILDTLTPMGELERMTQYKDKSGKSERDQLLKAAAEAQAEIDRTFQHVMRGATHPPETAHQAFGKFKNLLDSALASEKTAANVGLFTYPTLMAADIILYDAQVVPVGEDQLQHLELTRTLARKFNSRFGKLFVEPKPLMTEFPRVMSLDNVEKKMSKSQPGGCLFLDDTPEETEKKIMRAVTDSGSEVQFHEEKPGISNLLSIMSGFTGKDVFKLEKEFKGKNYGEFKKAAAKAINEGLSDFRKNKAALAKKEKAVKSAFDDGAKKAGVRADKKMKEVRKAVGLV